MTQLTVRIVAAVVDTRQLTLYKEDGTTIVLPQGDTRLKRIVEEATPQLIANKKPDGTSWADVVIDKAGDNAYAMFEAESNGVVRFFRIAKEKLKQLMSLGLVEGEPFPGSQEMPPMSVGTVPTAAEKALSAVDEIIKHAVPSTAPEFHERGVAQQANVVEEDGKTPKEHTPDDYPETIVAVVDNKVVPGVEKIKTQFSRAAKLGSTMGVENFLRRCAAVIEKRSHSIEDLLKFMERGDLPIADDGSILIYKVLKHVGDRTDGKYVDCHTSKVQQWTGAYVCMDESLVDHNRNNECSNGLHVARRGYIGNFAGSACVLAKLAPEDVITVPAYDANKMRVSGYHILMELTAKQFSLLKSNRPLTEDGDGKRLLANALAGKHIRRTHEVRITQQRGGGVVVKELKQAEAPKPAPTPDAPRQAEALENADKEKTAPAVDPKAVINAAEKVSRSTQAKKLYDAWANGEPGAEAELRAFKKASKVGWEKLGIPVGIDGNVKTPKGVKAVRTVPVKETIKPARGATYAIDPPSATQGSPRERIQKLLALTMTRDIAQKILDIKKASKKSWDNLGVKEVTVNHIMKLAGKE